MAAVLSGAQDGQIERRLAELLRRDVLPDLAGLEQRRRRHRLAYLAALAGLLAGIFLVFLLAQDLRTGLLPGVIVIAVGLLLMNRAERGYTDQLRRTVMPAICGAIGDLGHEVGSAPDLDLRELAEIGLVPRHNREQIDDVFRGRHRDTGFTMAEVRLRRVVGVRRRRSRTVFRGLIFAIDVPRPVPARILIARDRGPLGNGLQGWGRNFEGMRRVTLPDQGFEARFELYADRPDIALATVTPALCANLAALATAQGQARLQAAFAGGRFFVTMRRRGDQFRIGSLFSSTDRLADEATRVLQEVRIVHRLIDYLHGDRPPLRPAVEPAGGDRRTPGPVVRG